MAVSLSEKGRIDPDYMGTLLKKDGEAVIKELKDEKRIFMEPGETGAWETSEMYLSGGPGAEIATRRSGPGRDGQGLH